MNPNEEMRAYLNNDMDITKMSYAAIDNIRSVQHPLAPSSFIIKNDAGTLGDTTLPKSVEKIVMSDGAIIVTARGITLTIVDNEKEDSEDFLGDWHRLIDERDALEEDKESLAEENLRLKALLEKRDRKDLTIKQLHEELEDSEALVAYLKSKIRRAAEFITDELGAGYDESN